MFLRFCNNSLPRHCSPCFSNNMHPGQCSLRFCNNRHPGQCSPWFSNNMHPGQCSLRFCNNGHPGQCSPWFSNNRHPGQCIPWFCNNGHQRDSSPLFCTNRHPGQCSPWFCTNSHPGQCPSGSVTAAGLVPTSGRQQARHHVVLWLQRLVLYHHVAAEPPGRGRTAIMTGQCGRCVERH